MSANSAQKITPGSACKVLNQKTVYANKTYSCIKSGKKLLWNKGVAVKKPTPTPTETRRPQKITLSENARTFEKFILNIQLPIQTEEMVGYSIESQSQQICTFYGEIRVSFYEVGTCILKVSVKETTKYLANSELFYINVVAKPTPTPTPTPIPTPTPTPTPKVEGPVGKWQETQFAIVKSLSLLKPSQVQKLNFVYSPNVNKIEADKLQAAYQEPISLLSNLYVNPRPVTFLVFDETERDWWWTEATKLATKLPSDWWGGSHCQPNPMSYCGYGSMAEPDGTFHFGQLLGSQFLWKQWNYGTAYHESIHVYQLGLLGNRMSALPTWFAEGQANYLGHAFSHKYLDSNLQRTGQLSRLNSRFPQLSNFNQSQWVEWLKKVEADSDFTNKNYLGYDIGELIFEALYNSNEYEKIHSWMVAIKDGNNYKDAFAKVFEQNYDDWLTTTVALYLDSQI